MPKVVDESKLNYNRFPGERVTAIEDIVQVGGNEPFILFIIIVRLLMRKSWNSDLPIFSISMIILWEIGALSNSV